MTNHFRVAARTLTHLGAELITSDAIALNELIKNAFDAGSKSVEINFDVPFNPVLARKVSDRVKARTLGTDKARLELGHLISPRLNEHKRKEWFKEFMNLPSAPDKFSEVLR